MTVSLVLSIFVFIFTIGTLIVLTERVGRYVPSLVSSLVRVAMFAHVGLFTYMVSLALAGYAFPPSDVNQHTSTIIGALIGIIVDRYWQHRNTETKAKMIYQQTHAWTNWPEWRETFRNMLHEPREMLKRQSPMARSLQESLLDLAFWGMLFVAGLMSFLVTLFVADSDWYRAAVLCLILAGEVVVLYGIRHFAGKTMGKIS